MKKIAGGFGLFILTALVIGTISNVVAPRRTSTDESNAGKVQQQSSLGAVVTLAKAKGFWPCGSTEDALSEIGKWAALGDNIEVRRTMTRTHSVGLDGGMRVKVLDAGFMKRKVRVLTDSEGYAVRSDEKGTFSDPRVGVECWIDSVAFKADASQ